MTTAIMPGTSGLTGPFVDGPQRPTVWVIPNAHLPMPIGLPSYATLAETAAAPSDQQLTLSAANAPLRYSYGQVRIAPLVVNALLDAAGAMLLDCVLGDGPIGGVIATEINDAALPAGVTVTVYDGSQVAFDAPLAAAWALQGVAFAEVRPGVAYAVLKIPATVDVSIDERSIAFTVQGLKVFDPRDLGTRYSNNPALCLANFLAHPTRGPGDTVDWASVAAVADRCDTLLATKKRHTFGLTFDQQVPKKEIEETLRTGFCFVVREGPITYLVADMPVDVSATQAFAATDWQPDELRVSQRTAASAPNRITVRYTNTAIKPWAEAYTEPIETADVTAGLVDAVEMVVNATFVQDYAEAIRLRNRYFAEHTLGLRTLDFPVFEKGYKVRRGDVIRIDNAVDLIAKPVRVQKLIALGFARVQITAQEYQPSMYSDDSPASPNYPPTALPSPLTVLPVLGLTMVEEVYIDQLQTAGSGMASAATWLSRFRCTWTPSVDRYFVDYVLRFLNGAQLIFEGRASGAEYVTPPVQQARSYTVEVRARNTLGFMSIPPATKSAVALGKLLLPGPVPRISQALELGGEVILAWDPAPDIDVIRYEWRYTPNTIAGSWESATLIDRVDGLRTRFKGLPVGTHRFYIKPIDSVPQYSLAAAYADITVTSDSDAFLQAREFVNPMLNDMVAYQIEGEQHQRWITSSLTTLWNTSFTNAMSTYVNPIATYGSLDSKWTGEFADVGSLLTGVWTITPNIDVLSGALQAYFKTSTDGVSPAATIAGLTYTGAARWVKPYFSGGGGAFQVSRPPTITLAVVPKKESATGAVYTAGGPTTIALIGKYAKAVRIGITPRGTVARTFMVDNVLLSTTGFHVMESTLG